MSQGQYKVPENDAFLMKLSIFLATLISIIFAIFTFMREYTADMMTLHLKLGGKLFIVCFLTAFSAASLYHFFPSKFTHWLRYHRKYFGLGAVVVMFWHFLVIGLKVGVDWGFAVRELTPGEVIPSIVGLFFLGGMGLTSSAKMHAKLGHARWQRFHTYGGNLFLANLWFGTIDGFDLHDIPLFLATTIIIILKAARSLDLKLKKDGIPFKKILPPFATGYVICAVLVQIYFPAAKSDDPMANIPEAPEYRAVFAKEDIFPAQNYLPLKQGNMWTYRVTYNDQQTRSVTYDVRSSQILSRKPRYRLHMSDNLYLDMIQDNYGVRVVNDNRGKDTLRFDPPAVHLPHLALGQQVTFPVQIQSDSQKNKDDNMMHGFAEFELAAIEPITVPAGTYADCLRINYAQRIGLPGGSYQEVRGTAWYAPNTGKVKDERTIERYDAKPNKSVRTQELLELTESNIQ